ncbi:MAG: tRNA preQ1(34) S-adenosylmethionine ribosyltransferase-isomerase QueA [Oscillospiraceae bacterium]|nr:tRNA preQ1(34) S-adenosylmethionine ribosyltransferase-isomerase QueA [Oscillospiraceae bacterium]
MKKSDFYYELPEELIAQTPLERRDDSRLLVLPRDSGDIGHLQFRDLPSLLRAGDCLVLNDSRVIPARLFGKLATGGAIEVVLLRETGGGVWECLTRPGRKMKPDTRVTFADELSATVVEIAAGGNRLLKFDYDGVFLEILERLGRVPLPPYIHAELPDAERYQTVYSRESGSAAAPTAGLHFTPELLKTIAAQGVDIEYLTLHVGLGTFRPVKADDIENHEMHAEYCEIAADTAARINAVKARGGRVIAVGTTSCRTLESATDENGKIRAYAGFTDIFIYPGYKFRAIDGLITNFHLPESTLIMLVSALAGRERVLSAYAAAVRERYRFFSFGDAMAII